MLVCDVVLTFHFRLSCNMRLSCNIVIPNVKWRLKLMWNLKSCLKKWLKVTSLLGQKIQSVFNVIPIFIGVCVVRCACVEWHPSLTSCILLPNAGISEFSEGIDYSWNVIFQIHFAGALNTLPPLEILRVVKMFNKYMWMMELVDYGCFLYPCWDTYLLQLLVWKVDNWKSFSVVVDMVTTLLLLADSHFLQCNGNNAVDLWHPSENMALLYHSL